MKENSIKDERSFIEKAIKTMEHWIEYEKNNKEKINKADELINIQETILLDYKRVLKENEELKEDNYNVINKIENKIDRFDYEFEKAKRQNNKDKSDYYWDLIRNLKKLLESEE